ncbi:MAG: hypothetical protein CMI56_00930 [Parcubacteria group bacterium]|nr:hypothetical protein [Parcubacteria group bacterium]
MDRQKSQGGLLGASGTQSVKVMPTKVSGIGGLTPKRASQAAGSIAGSGATGPASPKRKSVSKANRGPVNRYRGWVRILRFFRHV